MLSVGIASTVVSLLVDVIESVHRRCQMVIQGCGAASGLAASAAQKNSMQRADRFHDAVESQNNSEQSPDRERVREVTARDAAVGGLIDVEA